MLISLSKNRPKEMSKEEFEKMWNNLGYSLSALYTTCQEMLTDLNKVKENDFSVPNHYALLAFKAGKKEMLEEIMKYLPESAK
jgi:hypothetical protein